MNLIKKINIACFGLLVLMSIQLSAQNGANPFELEHRIKQERRTIGEAVIDDVVETPQSAESENPFEVIRVAPKKSNNTVQVTPEKKDDPLSIVPTNDKNFRFWLLLSMLISLALILSLYRQQAGRAYRAFANENVMRMLHRDKGTVAYIPYYILYMMFILSAGIYVYLLCRYYEVPWGGSNISLFGLTVGGVALVFFIKQTFLRFLGAIFPIEKETSFYNMTITIFGIILCFILITFNALIAYGPLSIMPTVVYSSFLAIGGIYLFRSIRGLSIGAKFLGSNKFHFFIYLCTVEIAPVLILWKILANGAGMPQI